MHNGFILLLLLLLPLLLPAGGGASAPTIAVIADWGGIPLFPYTTPYQLTLAKSLDQEAGRLPLQAVLGLGDNFYFDGVSSVDDPRFEETFEQAFASSRLQQLPWYFVAGNHDWRGNVSAQILYSARSKRWNFPDYFYTKVFQLNGQCAAFVMIDTVVLESSLSGKDLLHPAASSAGDPTASNPYLQWIEKQLVQYQTCPYLFVAGHYPVWSMGHHGPTPSLRRWLDPLLVRYRVSAYLCGHDHNLQHISVNGTDYFVAGAGAYVNPSSSHLADLPAGSLKYFWNSEFDLDAAYLLLSFGSDHANATFHEATAQSAAVYQHRLLPRSQRPAANDAL